VLQRWAGPIVVVLMLGGVIALLALNLNWKGRSPADSPSNTLPTARIAPASRPAQAPLAAARQPAGFREYPIGDEVEKNQMLIKAVWLPPVEMEGMDMPGSSNLIHLEADIHATEGNRNGFAKDEFVPYLIVHYTITPADGKGNAGSVKPIEGELRPMVARDGLHYGATIEMPKAGLYRLTYAIKPPSAGGLGRHVDRATGVEPWWQPFEASFDLDYPGPPPAGRMKDEG
jgi:periplasmic iron binding protein